MNNRIVLLDQPCKDLDNLRNDCGELAICVPTDAEISLNIKSEQLTELEKIVSQYANSIDLHLVGDDLLKLNSVHVRKLNQNTIYRAMLVIDGIALINGFLYIEKTQETVNNAYVEYAMQVIGTAQQWKEYLKANTLKDLDLGTYTHVESGSGSLAPLFDNTVYQNGGDTIYPLIANMGRWYGETEANIIDVRFLVHKKAIIDKMFCAAGYKVRSRFFESHYFRRESDYLLEPNFGINESIVKGIDTEVEATFDQIVQPSTAADADKSIRFDNTIIDASGYWVHTPGPYPILPPDQWLKDITRAEVVTDVFVRWTGTIEGTGTYTGTGDVRLFMIYNESGAGFAVLDLGLFAVSSGGTVDFDITVDIQDFVRNQLGFNVRGFMPSNIPCSISLYADEGAFPPSGFEATIQAGTKAFFYTENRHHFNYGDVVDIAQVLRGDFSLYDWLLWQKTLYNLRFDTDEARKVVYIEPEPSKYRNYSTKDVAEQELNGFEADPNLPFDIIDLTPYVDVCESIEKDFSEKEQELDFDFVFKNSTDQYEKYAEFDDTNPLFGNLVTERAGREIKKIETGYQPTLNDYDFTISSQSPNFGAYLPFMWAQPWFDEENNIPPEPDSNIEPRTLHIYGNGYQYSTDTPPTQIGIRYFGNPNHFVPCVGQVMPVPIDFLGVSPIVNVFENNVFKDNLEQWQDKNLKNTLYEDSIKDALNVAKVTLVTQINSLFYHCISPRKLFKIQSCKGGLGRFNGIYKLINLKYNTTTKQATFELKPIVYCINT